MIKVLRHYSRQVFVKQNFFDFFITFIFYAALHKNGGQRLIGACRYAVKRLYGLLMLVSQSINFFKNITVVGNFYCGNSMDEGSNSQFRFRNKNPFGPFLQTLVTSPISPRHPYYHIHSNHQTRDSREFPSLVCWHTNLTIYIFFSELLLAVKVNKRRKL